jgi:internalin A
MWKLLSGTAVVLACAFVVRADEAEDPAAKWAEGVGGTVTRDAKVPGKPVVAVSFGPVNKKVTNDGLKELKAFKNLKNLNIFFCEQITNAGMTHVKELKSLETLSLGNTSVADDGLAELKDLKGLKVLGLAGCIKMTDKAAETINGFIDLEELSLPSTITENGVKKLAGLKKLKTLDLGGADMSDNAVKHIAGAMPDLQSLEIGTESGTRVSDASVRQFAKLKKLRSLGLRGSQVTDKGLKELKELLPDCKITR